jgi:hypothetical protein
MSICTIYALSDPRLERTFENVRYVGKTNQSLALRLIGHTSKESGSYKRSWIKSLKSEGVSPAIWPIEFCCNDNWQQREQWWIKNLRQYAKLTNLTDGGDGNWGRKWTESQRAAASAQRKGRPVSIEARAKISAALTGRKNPPFTEQQLMLMSEAKRGKKQSPDVVEKRASKLRGRKYDWGWKISLATTGIKKGNQRPDDIAKRVASRAGYKHSQETIDKIRKSNSHPVMCVQTGEVFPSRNAARVNNISRAITKGIKAGGYNWVYADNIS